MDDMCGVYTVHMVFVFHSADKVIRMQTFKFFPNASTSCQNVLIPRLEVNLFSATQFTASIVVSSESGVEMGDTSTAVVFLERNNGTCISIRMYVYLYNVHAFYWG